MKLEVAVEDVSQCVKNLTIEVPADVVRTEFNKAYESYQRVVKMPGFRPGRAPRDLVKSRFKKEIKEDVFKRIIPHAYQHAVEDAGLRVVGDPAILDDPNAIVLNDGEPMKFNVKVEVVPEFELKEYKGLKATRRVVKVMDEAVEKTLQTWRESAGQLIPIEGRPSQIGDVVTANLVGKYVESPEQEDLRADDVKISLGGEGTHPSFTEYLTGVNAGDERKFRVVYPEDFTSKGLAGKTLDFTAAVGAIHEIELPELDDEFAKSFARVDSIEDLRQRVREAQQQQHAADAENNLRDDLLKQLVAQYDFEVPPSLVKGMIEKRAAQFAEMLHKNGMKPEDIKSIDWPDYFQQVHSTIIHDVRAMFIASEISSKEQLSVTQAELDTEIAQIAEAARESFHEIKARLTKEEGLSSIENRLLYIKALDVVVQNAEISVEEITPEQAAEQSKAEATPET